MPPASNAFRMADRLADGQLRDLLRGYRSEGMSWRQINVRLFRDFGIEVSDYTLRDWAESEETDNEGAA